jgi:hypothetical protein
MREAEIYPIGIKGDTVENRGPEYEDNVNLAI